ncbi:MAG: ribonuclease HI family protein [Candidatus Micrarchaeaceae archaeon]
MLTYEILVYTDGASRDNPGKSASGYLILDGKKEILETFYNGKKSNNEAEYIAVISALKKLIKEGKESFPIILYSDSEIIVKQLNKLYKVKDHKLIQLNEEVIKLSKQFMSCKFVNVPRENKHISRVDTALNQLLDSIEDK